MNSAEYEEYAERMMAAQELPAARRKEKLAEAILLQHVRSQGLPIPVAGAVNISQYEGAIRATARQAILLADKFLEELKGGEK